uniref:RRM domain-containing protein n=2 Tax=Chromera velia CCMP2878 TaxID=1169474 RepID=A0A0K6S5R5_9ALVE|eukprot:Cvel_14443.t2-p1 / transcript=Cvel_14443.t2 / gene=Cvel_14443 / organism=Chromera_velia_CCMP2878 / gene_product=hypothetical protein / transcript_product=hypothetical protein / location=Cvel_scaffold1028:15128-23933(-) / protein_length=1765 / sequence_SO=supercontig / SO=protein_coding / is_pseudo=false
MSHNFSSGEGVGISGGASTEEAPLFLGREKERAMGEGRLRQTTAAGTPPSFSSSVRDGERDSQAPNSEGNFSTNFENPAWIEGGEGGDGGDCDGCLGGIDLSFLGGGGEEGEDLDDAEHVEGPHPPPHTAQMNDGKGMKREREINSPRPLHDDRGSLGYLPSYRHHPQHHNDFHDKQREDQPDRLMAASLPLRGVQADAPLSFEEPTCSQRHVSETHPYSASPHSHSYSVGGPLPRPSEVESSDRESRGARLKAALLSMASRLDTTGPADLDFLESEIARLHSVLSLKEQTIQGQEGRGHAERDQVSNSRFPPHFAEGKETGRPFSYGDGGAAHMHKGVHMTTAPHSHHHHEQQQQKNDQGDSNFPQHPIVQAVSGCSALSTRPESATTMMKNKQDRDHKGWVRDGQVASLSEEPDRDTDSCCQRPQSPSDGGSFVFSSRYQQQQNQRERQTPGQGRWNESLPYPPDVSPAPESRETALPLSLSSTRPAHAVGERDRDTRRACALPHPLSLHSPSSEVLRGGGKAAHEALVFGHTQEEQEGERRLPLPLPLPLSGHGGEEHSLPPVPHPHPPPREESERRRSPSPPPGFKTFNSQLRQRPPDHPGGDDMILAPWPSDRRSNSKRASTPEPSPGNQPEGSDPRSLHLPISAAEPSTSLSQSPLGPTAPYPSPVSEMPQSPAFFRSSSDSLPPGLPPPLPAGSPSSSSFPFFPRRTSDTVDLIELKQKEKEERARGGHNLERPGSERAQRMGGGMCDEGSSRRDRRGEVEGGGHPGSSQSPSQMLSREPSGDFGSARLHAKLGHGHINGKGQWEGYGGREPGETAFVPPPMHHQESFGIFRNGTTETTQCPDGEVGGDGTNGNGGDTEGRRRFTQGGGMLEQRERGRERELMTQSSAYREGGKAPRGASAGLNTSELLQRTSEALRFSSDSFVSPSLSSSHPPSDELQSRPPFICARPLQQQQQSSGVSDSFAREVERGPPPQIPPAPPEAEQENKRRAPSASSGLGASIAEKERQLDEKTRALDEALASVETLRKQCEESLRKQEQRSNGFAASSPVHPSIAAMCLTMAAQMRTMAAQNLQHPTPNPNANPSGTPSSVDLNLALGPASSPSRSPQDFFRAAAEAAATAAVSPAAPEDPPVSSSLMTGDVGGPQTPFQKRNRSHSQMQQSKQTAHFVHPVHHHQQQQQPASKDSPPPIVSTPDGTTRRQRGTHTSSSCEQGGTAGHMDSNRPPSSSSTFSARGGSIPVAPDGGPLTAPPRIRREREREYESEGVQRERGEKEGTALFSSEWTSGALSSNWKPVKVLWIGPLARGVTIKDLEPFCQKSHFGKRILQLKDVGPAGGSSRTRYAEMHFESGEEAESASKTLHGTMLGGRQIVVFASKPSQDLEIDTDVEQSVLLANYSEMTTTASPAPSPSSTLKRPKDTTTAGQPPSSTSSSRSLLSKSLGHWPPHAYAQTKSQGSRERERDSQPKTTQTSLWPPGLSPRGTQQQPQQPAAPPGKTPQGIPGPPAGPFPQTQTMPTPSGAGGGVPGGPGASFPSPLGGRQRGRNQHSPPPAPRQPPPPPLPQGSPSARAPPPPQCAPTSGPSFSSTGTQGAMHGGQAGARGGNASSNFAPPPPSFQPPPPPEPSSTGPPPTGSASGSVNMNTPGRNHHGGNAQPPVRPSPSPWGSLSPCAPGTTGPPPGAGTTTVSGGTPVRPGGGPSGGGPTVNKRGGPPGCDVLTMMTPGRLKGQQQPDGPVPPPPPTVPGGPPAGGGLGWKPPPPP